uniref:Uncharacterized protein n=1 Tax=Manihot esculenta TaxID=3983 RepID=A0A2C9U072_MANES
MIMIGKFIFQDFFFQCSREPPNPPSYFLEDGHYFSFPLITFSVHSHIWPFACQVGMHCTFPMLQFLRGWTGLIRLFFVF